MDKKLLFISIAVIAVGVSASPLVLSTNDATAVAEKAPAKVIEQSKKAKHKKPKTRTEAIARAERRVKRAKKAVERASDHLAKLEAMSDQEWLQRKQKRQTTKAKK